jgi:hypothetical protein
MGIALTSLAFAACIHAKITHGPESEKPGSWWKPDGSIANALEPAEDVARLEGQATPNVATTTPVKQSNAKVACNLVYYENATSGGGQVGTQCFAKPREGEMFGPRVKLASKLELPRNYQWGQYVDVEFVYPESQKVALRSVHANEPRLPEERMVTLSNTEVIAMPLPTGVAAAVWPKKMRVLAMMPQLSDGSGTSGWTLGATAKQRISAIRDELLGKGQEHGTSSSINTTFASGSFHQLQLSKAGSQVLHLPLLNLSYKQLLADCSGVHCCEKKGDVLKGAMLAKLPKGLRLADFDLLVYYLRGDLLGCPRGRDGYSYFGTVTPNRASPGFKVRRDMTAWRAGVTMYEGGINNARTLARAIGHSLGLHHAGGEGQTQPAKPVDAFTKLSLTRDGHHTVARYGEENAFMGSLRNNAMTFTAPVSSFLGFLPDEQVIQAITVGDEVHSLAELRAYELGPMGHQGDGLAMRIACADGCQPKVADFQELFAAYPREGRFLWASFLHHPAGDDDLARKVHVHFSANSGGDAGIFTERWRYLAAGESFMPKPSLAIYVCAIGNLTATVSVGTSVSNAKSLCGSKPQTTDIRMARQSMRRPSGEAGVPKTGMPEAGMPEAGMPADGLAASSLGDAKQRKEGLVPECTNGNDCGHCLRALQADECPADLATAVADSSGFSRLCGRGGRKGHLCAGSDVCGATQMLANCAWAKGIYEIQECVDSAPGSLTITVRNGTEEVNDCARLAHVCNSSVEWVDDFRQDCPVTCGLCGAPSLVRDTLMQTPAQSTCTLRAAGTKVDRCVAVGKPSDGVDCRDYWMQRDKTWSFCTAHATEDTCWADPVLLPHC